MTGTLKVTPEKLTAAANEFNGYNNQISNLTSQMMSVVRSLNGTVWQGEAQQSYVNKFTKLEGDMGDIRKKIADFVQDLSQMAANYKASEKKVVTSTSPLKTDIIH